MGGEDDRECEREGGEGGEVEEEGGREVEDWCRELGEGGEEEEEGRGGGEEENGGLDFVYCEWNAVTTGALLLLVILLSPLLALLPFLHFLSPPPLLTLPLCPLPLPLIPLTLSLLPASPLLLLPRCSSTHFPAHSPNPFLCILILPFPAFRLSPQLPIPFSLPSLLPTPLYPISPVPLPAV
ncbi:unnamed protein product [Closterium sp. NIES-54]